MDEHRERNKALIRRWIAPAPDGSGPFLLTDAARELLAEDAVWHLPPSAEIPGVAAGGVVRGRGAIHGIQRRARDLRRADDADAGAPAPRRRRLGGAPVLDALPRRERAGLPPGVRVPLRGARRAHRRDLGLLRHAPRRARRARRRALAPCGRSDRRREAGSASLDG